VGLRQHVDSSGFPLQLAIANKFPRTRQNWHVLYEEHQWRHKDQSGFIDLVIEDETKTWLMNIECKRVRDSSWIFLKDSISPPRRRHAKLWVSSRRSDDSMTHFDWADIPIDPECEESSFCVVPGQDSKARPMLERLSATVVLSTEALAAEEASTVSEQYSHLRIYQNVIVTTAELKVCEINIENINVATGEIPEDAQFTDVPFVRFRKQLGSTQAERPRAQLVTDIHGRNRERESTIFVVNSQHLDDFIYQCELPDDVGQYVRAR